MHPDDRSFVQHAVSEAHAAGRGFRLQERVVRPGGEVRVLASAGDVVVDDSGRVTAMYGACHDITEQQRNTELRHDIEHKRLALEQQFYESQKLEAVGRLAGGIAHDFNNMLQVIMGSADLLLESRSPDDAEWNDLRAIEDAAERASGLTRQLLAVARRQVLAVADADVNDVICDIEDMLRRTLGAGITFVLTLANHPLVVRADAGQLQQVLLNLTVNARDAMPDGGTLTIATREVRDVDGQAQAVIDVSDTGTGMDPETLRHTFEPFFTTKGAGGTGLGLATVYGIVSQSGGRADVRSALGQGSSFSVRLPRLETEAAATRLAADRAGAKGGRETVMVVDDSEPVLALTSRILDRAGYTVLTAPSGNWALSVAQRHPDTIHLLLTDVMMPGMPGPQLARALAPRGAWLRSTRRGRHTEQRRRRHTAAYELRGKSPVRETSGRTATRR
ncbi:MAG: ATP-binding protein [Acidobacteriota bacterium]|nr:ATP-binding protein [Acidobacteriota bacterium]